MSHPLNSHLARQQKNPIAESANITGQAWHSLGDWWANQKYAQNLPEAPRIPKLNIDPQSLLAATTGIPGAALPSTGIGNTVETDALHSIAQLLPGYELATDKESRVPLNLGLEFGGGAGDLAALGSKYLASNPNSLLAIAGMFGGRKAKNFDVNAMNQAEKMESAGADAETIWTDTGMFRGADGEWRFEISDEAATIWRNPKSETLEDTIYHPELYENYPQLRELRAADEKIDSQGLYRPPSSGYGGEVITQSGTTYPGRKSIALHETQHAIQEIEGFNKGTAPRDIRIRLWDEIDSDAIGTVMQKYDIDGDYAPGESPAKWLGDRYREALDAGATLTELKPLRAETARIAKAERGLKLKAYEEYKLSAGEVEARNTELRRNWSDTDRANKSPLSTEDSPRESQTVNRSYDGEVFEPVRQNIYGDGKWYVVDRNGEWGTTPYNTKEAAQRAQNSLASRNWGEGEVGDQERLSLSKILDPDEDGYSRVAADGYDIRFDPRKGEQDKLAGLTTKVEGTLDAPPPISLVDILGRDFITTMSDRTAAGGKLVGIKGTELDAPVNLLGGQDFMFNNPGQVWASAQSPISQISEAAKRLKSASGTDPLLLPWRMSPSGGDFAHVTGETMIKYADANMTKRVTAKANTAIKKIIPGWKGINDPSSIEQFNLATTVQRRKVKNILDTKFRDDGGLSIGEARLAVADPTQIDALSGGIQNVGQIDSSSPLVSQSGHLTYPYGLPGEGIGRIDQDISIIDLLPALRDDPSIKNLRRKMELQPQVGRITEEIIRDLEKAQ
jgi:hypothetical protein